MTWQEGGILNAEGTCKEQNRSYSLGSAGDLRLSRLPYGDNDKDYICIWSVLLSGCSPHDCLLLAMKKPGVFVTFRQFPFAIFRLLNSAGFSSVGSAGIVYAGRVGCIYPDSTSENHSSGTTDEKRRIQQPEDEWRPKTETSQKHHLFSGLKANHRAGNNPKGKHFIFHPWKPNYIFLNRHFYDTMDSSTS